MNCSKHFLLTLFLTGSVFAGIVTSQEDSANPRGLELLSIQAADLKPLFQQSVSLSFLSGVDSLPEIESRDVYVNRDNSRDAVLKDESELLEREARQPFELKRFDEHYYYHTRDGSPLAFARVLEVAAANGFATLDGTRLIDFGFGSIGHLCLLASCGADVTGVEVDRVLRAL